MDVTLALALVAGISFVIAGLLGILGVRVSNLVRVASASVAAGILLGITISDLIPEAIEMASSAATAYGFAAGFGSLFLLETVGRAHTHHHDPDDEHQHVHDDHARKVVASHHRLWPFLIGISVHNLADGMSVGFSSELSHEAATTVTAGVLVHQLPVGISFAAVLAAMAATRRTVVRGALVAGLMIPVGAIAVAAAPGLTEEHVGWAIAAVAGALTYVACGHLLPEAQSEERHRLLGFVFPVSLVATVTLFATVLAHAE